MNNKLNFKEMKWKERNQITGRLAGQRDLLFGQRSIQIRLPLGALILLPLPRRRLDAQRHLRLVILCVNFRRHRIRRRHRRRRRHHAAPVGGGTQTGRSVASHLIHFFIIYLLFQLIFLISFTDIY